MKIQNIYHLLQAALLLLLVSCTQEEFPAVQDKAQQLTISVTDGGYTSAVENMKTRVETRAVENGYTTEFTEGDACGFYMVRGGKPVYSNVKLTAEKDAATGGIMWKTDGTTLAAGMDGESYYLYYPYQADMAGKTATPAEGAVMTDAEFFKPLIDGWQPGDDQSTHAAYTASDLMTAGGSTTGTGNTIHLSFAMKHRMALAVIEMPKTVYKFIDANVPDYTVGAEATFTGTAKPLRMADGTYRYLVHSSMPTIEGCYDGGNREFTITTSASHPVVGEYKRYKVDGAAETIKNVTYAESGIARIGDFYCTKNNGTTGYLIPKEADETTVQAAKVVGIVFQTDKSRIGAKEKEKLGGEGNVHGLVMAVKNIATRQAWGLFGMDERGLQHAGRKPITTTTSAVTEIASISAPIAATSTVIPHSRPPMIITRPVRFLRPRPAGIFQPPANGGTSCKIWAVVRLWRTLPSKPRQTLENSSGRAKEMFPPL